MRAVRIRRRLPLGIFGKDMFFFIFCIYIQDFVGMVMYKTLGTSLQFHFLPVEAGNLPGPSLRCRGRGMGRVIPAGA